MTIINQKHRYLTTYNNLISGLKEIFYQDENSTVAQRVFWNSLYMAFFLLPIDINFPTPFFAIAVISGGMNIFKTERSYVSENKILFLFPLYFLVLLSSLLYTSNLSDGSDLMVRSLSLLLFPIIFLFVKEDANAVRKLFDFLLYGLVLSFFINLFAVCYDVVSVVKGMEGIALPGQVVKGWKFFMHVQFSSLVNPSYVSLYILLVLGYYLKREMDTVWRFLIVLVLFLYLFLLANEAAYLTLFIMSLLLLIKVKDQGKRYLLVLLLVLGTVVFINNPRFLRAEGAIPASPMVVENENPTISPHARWRSWKAAVKTIEEAPLFGYGIGDAHDALVAKYKELGYTENHRARYNAHNQFLQTWLETGLFGVFILIAIFTWLTFYMRRSLNEFSVFLALFIALLFESMLVRFNGIVFFSIIVPLLLKKKSILSSRIIRNVESE